MTRLRAFVRQVPDSFRRAVTARPLGRPLDPERAAAQHAEYTATLTLSGFEVGVIPPDEAYPDSCFVEDAVLIVGDRAITTRPGHPSRRGEVTGVAAALRESMPVAALDTGHLDGGDVLQVGSTVFVGRSSRTNGEGIAALRESIGEGRTIVPVDVRSVLHLKSGVTAIADDAVLWHPAACDRDALVGVDVVPVGGDDPEAANVVRLPDGSVLVSSAHIATAELLEGRGLRVVTVDVSEFARADGGLTCLSVRSGEGLAA